jgi:type II secretory pathway component PulJ
MKNPIMVRLLKYLLACNFKAKRQLQKASGFTLIELLVGLIIAFLVILPLLGFMVNMLQTDRQEQAKATSEQEIQAALDYIARDLDQAVFIYDGTGVSAISARNGFPAIPTGKTGTPVLAFWKRKFLSQEITVPGGSDDAFAYSLVVYYLLKETNCANSTWSCTAQIGRVELQAPVTQAGSTSVIRGEIPLFNPSSTGSVAGGSTTSGYIASMNAWPTNSTTPAANYTTPTNPSIPILIDYVDQSPITGGDPNIPQPNCPVATQKVPPSTTTAFGSEISGFYACVDNTDDKNTAKVYIRGNALARLRLKTAPPNYASSQSSYFPSSSIQVGGRGILGDRK